MLAPAKINLMLHITGKRADGYHALQSLVMFASVGDNIFLEPSDNFELSVTGEFADDLRGDNLIANTSWALADVADIKPYGRITLEKNLPVGAGLGGGSADAAASMEMLASYWNCNFSKSRLQHIAQDIGSDIPACIHNAPLWMEGAGERITPLSIAFDVPVLLVNPRKSVSTGDVYARVAPPYAQAISLPTQFSTLPELVAFLYMTHNALEAPARQIEPMVGETLAKLTDIPSCLLARMSGSGATCFGIFPTEAACEHAEKIFKDQHPGWWIKATTLKRGHG